MKYVVIIVDMLPLDLTVNKNHTFTLVSLYGYYTDENELFNSIYQNIALYKNSSVLLCGDWNFVLDKDIDTNSIL